MIVRDEINNFLEAEFPQINGDYEIINFSSENISILNHISQKHLRPGGTISGPTMFALADVSFYIAILANIGTHRSVVTTNCNIDFLKKPSPVNLIAKPRIIKLGKSLIVGDVFIYSEGINEPVARANLTYSYR
ncbi:PaaI family thioesterase [Amylibacter sp.]|nr:PaaI family thioesterase [Amylibacter sp.]